MKHLLSITLILFLGSFSFSQDSSRLELQAVHKQEIEIYKKDWWKRDWPKIRRKYKIDFDCAQCKSIALDLRVTVDEKGSVVDVKVINDKVHCLTGLKRQDLIAAMTETVRHWDFSENFYTSVFDFRLGLIVTC